MTNDGEARTQAITRARRALSSVRRAFGSLGLTLACLAALMALVVGCTLVQGPLGTFQAVELYMRSWFVWWDLPRANLTLPVFPGGVLVGLLLAANLVAAQVDRLVLSWAKAGLWLAHAGLILLVAGEFVTGAFQREMRMVIEEGQTVSFLESPRELELAVVDGSDPAFDEVHAVPESRLARRGDVELPGTPFSLRVKRYFRNAEFSPRAPSDPAPIVTAGVGADVAVREIPPVAGDDERNRAAAFVEPMASGRSLGTFLVSNALASPQSFVHEGRTWALELRPCREPLPYALTLEDFRHEVYAGTDIPKSFSSLVHLSNRATGEERDVLISMNQPLRYAGKAFYQASFGKGDGLSILQVVENPGWLLPYAATALVAAGLLLHFGVSLRRGGRRRVGPPAGPGRPSAPAPTARSRAIRVLPWMAGAVALAGAGATLLRPGDTRGFEVHGFAQLPALEGGRVKPIDSVARNSLLVIRGRQTFQHEGRSVGADEWLLDVMFRPAVADAQPIFFVDDPEVLGLMGLAQTGERYFSVRALAPHLAEIERQATAARGVEARRRTRFQQAVSNLFDRVWLYHRLRNTIQAARSPGLGAEIAAASSAGAAERRAALAELAYFRPLPPVAGGPPDAWRNTGEALAAAARGDVDPALRPWARLARAWAGQDAPSFGSAVADLRRLAAAAAPSSARRASAELAFNRAEPFYDGMVIYVLALLVLLASWLWKPAALRATAYGLLVAGALVHTAGLACRVVLQGRPPVTNLYSSAVFVGWAAVVVGLVLERIHRRGLGTVVAAAAGFASLIVAHHLTGSGDTLEMMRAVLDSNFWLATHVVAITIGYSGTFLAGALAVGAAVRRHLSPRADPAGAKAHASLIHGVVCFSLLFSFVGTVLGGIWADQSWGRFWGWDPKENGALLIVLWNAAILHARLAGYVRERGIAAMAIFGNVVTSLSWFGVNMLGVGLHSYGFMDGAFRVLSGFIAAHLVLVGIALAPPRLGLASGAAPQPARKAPGTVPAS